MFQAHPFGILALAAVAMSWALAAVLFRVSTPNSVARKLALLLLIEGMTLGSSDAPWFVLAFRVEFLEARPLLATARNIVHVIGDCAMLALYPAFLAVALRTGMTRVFLQRRTRAGLVVAAGLFGFLIFVESLQRVGVTLLFLGLVTTFGFAFVASIQAWRAATGAARSRALAFALAFGFRDLCWGYNYAFALWEMWTDRIPLANGQVDLGYYLYVIGTLVAVPLIAYGILRTQLFDLDLRIRWTIKQSTIAGIFVALMFFISEGVSTFLSAELGSFAGLLAAAVVVFFLAPLQRFADRVASAAMPNTQHTPEYVAFRKMQVYEDALAEALHEDGISDRERALLVRLRDSLGIAQADAEAIERELQQRQTSPQLPSPAA
jgi:hypothetical protein